MAKLHYNHREDSILDIKLDKRKEVYNHGKNNAHPSLIETLIEGSVTAKTAVDKVAKSIYGMSFGEVGEIVVNSKGQTLNEVFRAAAREYSKHSQVYIHVGYNAEFERNSIRVIPNTYCRKGKDDDSGHISKIVVYDNWDKSKSTRIKPSEFQYVDVFNPKKAVVKAQMEKAGSIRDYRGQILHIQKDSNAIYSLSDLHPVMDDALLEAQAAQFRRRGGDEGFLNTKVMVVRPFADDDEEREFRDTMKGLKGADNSGGVLVLEATQPSDDLNKEIVLEDLSSPYNDKLFEYSEHRARKNIALAFGVPLPLLDSSEGSNLFGNSGELIRQMKIMLWENRDEERSLLVDAFSLITENFSQEVGELEIESPFEEVLQQEAEEVQETQQTMNDPQAVVETVLKIQESVHSGYTSRSSALAILSAMYGMDSEQAEKIIGNQFED